MKVLKFGGTSVGTVESINQVIQIIEQNITQGEQIAVVFSAMGGVTNRLIAIGNLASSAEMDYTEHIVSLEERHFNAIRKLIDVKNQSNVIAKIKGLFNEMDDLLRGVMLIGELSVRTHDLLISFGERLSTTIITETLKNRGIEANYLDSRRVIKTDENFGFATVDYELTNELIQQYFAENPGLHCITGFTGSSKKGVTTTLGRGGSDYTASIFGAALAAEVIEIWTDVNGMMTADPRKVHHAFTIPEISYAEAMELSHFGAKVIYPPSLIPAFAKEIPIKVLNTFNTTHPGTTIQKNAQKQDYSITGISSIDDLALVNVQGNGMIGVAGVSARIFTLLAENNISIILISQASSEHSICFAIEPKNVSHVKDILTKGLSEEIGSRAIDNIVVQENLSVIAIVGEGMRSSSGISGKLFSVLGRNGINVIATAQGSSELNISVVIEKKNLSKALNAIHESFFDVDGFTLNVFIIGATGLIGKTLLRQIKDQRTYLKERKNLNVNIVGLTNTRKSLIDTAGIDLENWETVLNQNGDPANISEFIEDIQALNLPYSVLVDNTASKDIIQYYEPLLRNSVSVVTPNKVANSGSYESYLKLRQIAQQRKVSFLYETNVGAGLPIIGTLQNLIESGDKIHKIEAVLSGTLAFIFNTFKVGDKFVDVVKEAKDRGFTEPDPREDLSGTDVARKILILAREVGHKLELDDVKVEKLLNEACENAVSVEAFYETLLADNPRFEEMLLKAEATDQKLRYIATLENGQASVGLKTIDSTHPFYNLSGSENIISFTTERYRSNPLVVKGPGAGAEVTAMGVFADIMSIGSFKE